jgi:hypothetical protein
MPWVGTSNNKFFLAPMIVPHLFKNAIPKSQFSLDIPTDFGQNKNAHS